MIDKLPEWPEMRGRTAHEALVYHMETADAALARMEALVEVVTKWRKHMHHILDEDELQAVDELLAACERRSAG